MLFVLLVKLFLCLIISAFDIETILWDIPENVINILKEELFQSEISELADYFLSTQSFGLKT